MCAISLLGLTAAESIDRSTLVGGFLPIFAYGVSTIGEAAGLLAWRWIFVSASQIHIDRICLQLSRSSAVSLPARLRSWHSLVSLGFHVARRILNLASDCGLVSQSAEVLPIFLYSLQPG